MHQLQKVCNPVLNGLMVVLHLKQAVRSCITELKDTSELINIIIIQNMEVF
jgi:hypothetical protein